MADLQIIGQIEGFENAETRLSVVYLTDWRDERGRLPPPVSMLRALPGAAFQGVGGSPGTLLGSDDPAFTPPVADLTYILILPGLLPFARTVRRRIFANTQVAGVFDFTLPEQQQPSWGGGAGTAPTVTALPGAGPQGEPGASLISAQGDPAPGLGQNGDSYLNTLTLDLYVKAAGAWALAATLRGEAGPAGADGQPGPPGASFPKPVPGDVNSIPVSDGSQPHGFSWRAISQLGLGAGGNLGDLDDVLLNRPLENGDALIWSSAQAKFTPVNRSEFGTSGSGTGAALLSELLDVETGSLDDKAILSYNVGLAVWEAIPFNAAMPALSLSGSQVETVAVRMPPSAGNYMEWSPAYYRTFIPIVDVTLSGLTDTVEHGGEVTARVWRDDTQQMIGVSAPVPVAAQVASGYAARFSSPVLLSAGQSYAIGWAATTGNVKIIFDSTRNVVSTYEKFLLGGDWRGVAYGQGAPRDSYPGLSTGEGSQDQANAFDLLLLETKAKNVSGPLEPIDFPAVAAVAALQNGAAALLTTGSAPRIVYRDAAGTLHYGPLFTASP